MIERFCGKSQHGIITTSITVPPFITLLPFLISTHNITYPSRLCFLPHYYLSPIFCLQAEKNILVFIVIAKEVVFDLVTDTLS